MRAKNPKAETPRRNPPDLPEDLAELTLSGVDEIRAGAPVSGAVFRELDLSGWELQEVVANISVFNRVALSGCVAGSVRLRDVRFVRCDLSNALLRGMQATRVEFAGCRLTGMRAPECDWRDVLVEDCDVRYAQWSGGTFRACEFRACSFQEADLQGSNLSGAVFDRVALKGADLRGARLAGADLRGAEIEGMIVLAENLRGAIVSPAQAVELVQFLGVVVR